MLFTCQTATSNSSLLLRRRMLANHSAVFTIDEPSVGSAGTGEAALGTVGLGGAMTRHAALVSSPCPLGALLNSTIPSSL